MDHNTPNTQNTPKLENPIIHRIKEDYIGRFVIEHARAMVALLVVIVLGAGAYQGYKFYTIDKKKKQNEEIFTFKATKVEPLISEKISFAEFKTSWDELTQQMKGNENLFPLAVGLADFLRSKNQLADAEGILSSVAEKYSANSYAFYYVGQSLAAVLDDEGKTKEAIAQLEKLVKSPVKTFEAKTYFDLGRLYKRDGDVEKARSNFQYLVDNFADNPFAKEARVYLREMQK